MAASPRPARHRQALRRGRGAGRRRSRCAARRGARRPRRERRRQVDADERRLRPARARRRRRSQIDGRPVRFASALDARRAGIGMVHQEFALVDALSVAENLALSLSPPGEWRWRPRAASPPRRRGWPTAVGLDLGDLDAPVGSLPVGATAAPRDRQGAGRRDARADPRRADRGPDARPRSARCSPCSTGCAPPAPRCSSSPTSSREVMAIADRVTVMRHGPRRRHAPSAATWTKPSWRG